MAFNTKKGKVTFWLGVRGEGDAGDQIYPDDDEGYQTRIQALDARKQLIKDGISNRRIVVISTWEEDV